MSKKTDLLLELLQDNTQDIQKRMALADDSGTTYPETPAHDYLLRETEREKAFHQQFGASNIPYQKILADAPPGSETQAGIARVPLIHRIAELPDNLDQNAEIELEGLTTDLTPYTRKIVVHIDRVRVSCDAVEDILDAYEEQSELPRSRTLELLNTVLRK